MFSRNKTLFDIRNPFSKVYFVIKEKKIESIINKKIEFYTLGVHNSISYVKKVYMNFYQKTILKIFLLQILKIEYYKTFRLQFLKF